MKVYNPKAYGIASDFIGAIMIDTNVEFVLRDEAGSSVEWKHGTLISAVDEYVRTHMEANLPFQLDAGAMSVKFAPDWEEEELCGCGGCACGA